MGRPSCTRPEAQRKVTSIGIQMPSVNTLARSLRWSPFFGQVGKLKSLRRSEEEERWRSANSTVGNSRRRWCCRL